MSALDKFVAKTGDLATARDMLQQLAELSTATGADLSDMADAAGDVANNIEDGPNKAGRTIEVLKLIAAQGKEGAVEIKDLATQMAKVASAAAQFSGDKGKNIAEFGALTQFARQRGGASSATQAAQSTMAFMSQFGKGARLDAFKNYGVETHDQNGRVRDAEDIILESIQAAASKGGVKNIVQSMGEMVKDSAAQRVTRPFIDTFQTNYANAQGTEQQRITTAIAETRAEFDRLKSATMDEAQIQQNLAGVLRETSSQSTILNNRIQESSQSFDQALKPAIMETSRALIPLAKWIGDTMGNLTGHTQETAMSDDNALEVDAAQKAARVRDEMRSGKVNPEDAAAAQDALEKLQATHNALQAKIAKRENFWNSTYTDVFDAATGNGDIKANEIAQDKQEDTSLERTIATLNDTMQAVHQTLKTNGIGRATEGERAPGSPPAVDGTGRSRGAHGAPPR